MSEREHDALEALRRIDGPAELDDGAEERIEEAMLARFDVRIGEGSPLNESSPIVALESRAERSHPPRSHRLAMGMVAAAAVAVVAGFVAILARDDSAPTNPPAAAPETTAVSTTVPGSDDAALIGQLDAFCDAFVAPTRDADALWQPDGSQSETRLNVLVAVEQAAQAMSELDPPLGDRLADSAEQLVGATTDARLAHSLDEAEADDAVRLARDLLFDAPATVGVPEVPDSCSRST